MKRVVFSGFVIILFLLAAMPVKAQPFYYSGKMKDTTVNLHPDTNDSYILSYYITGRYRIEIGYNTYFTELKEFSKIDPNNVEPAIKHYIDSVKKEKKLVPLYTQPPVYFKGAVGFDFELDSFTYQIIAYLFYKGNIKVYDFRKKGYLEKIIISGKDNGTYVDYIDPVAGKTFFTYIISSPVY